LGRDTPAVAGTKITLFTLMAGGGLAVVNEGEHISAFTRKTSSQEYHSLTAEPVITDKNKEEPNMDENKLKAELAAKDAQVNAFKQELEELKADGKKQDAVAYFGKLWDEGKLSPALFEKVVALDIGLTDDQRKGFRPLFDELKPLIDLSGKHFASKSKVDLADAGNKTLAAKIRAFQKEHHIASFAEAAEAMHAEHPALFDGEGGTA
jgi:hypothetical protein